MSQKKRSDKNSVSAAVDGFQGAMQDVPIPEGVQLRSDEEVVIWEQFTRARAREDWRDMDLLLLAKVVKMEADLRAHQKALDEQGAIIPNQRGTLVMNPLASLIDTIERRQLAVIRSMSLNQQASDPRTVNGKGKEVSKIRKSMDDKSALLASPEG